ncbi:MAG: helicase-related protein [Nostocales cyanobacterium 94392]|nr:helicase-related protein [Nostocales cyanobacterium 94392]
MSSKISEDLGRLFEVGFNIGILTYIKQKQIKYNFENLYFEELQQLKFPQMLKSIVSQVISTLEREMMQKWCIFYLQKGFLSGLNFFAEYLESISWNEPHKIRHLEILYYQCQFSGDNSIGTYEGKNKVQWFQDIISQLNINLDKIQDYQERYFWKGLDLGKKGEFVNADTLILLRYRKQVRILCVDLSIFSIKSNQEVQNLDFVEILRNSLVRDISYLRSKSIFAQLSIDTQSLDFEFTEDLKNYFTAFKYKDKESAKLIQAGGYVYSFYNFLKENSIIHPDDKLIFNAVGYSDRGISAMSVNSDNLTILKNCYEIYTYDSSIKEINQARKQLLNRIKRSAYHSFIQGKSFVDALLSVPSLQITNVIHQEQIEGFFNSVGQVPQNLMDKLGLNGSLDLRNAHAELIKKQLISDSTYLFLTGNPGIGKTTAIANFLKSQINEGFLFFYVSHRKQVNLDIIQKFQDKNSNKLSDDRILAINSYSNLISDNQGEYTVQYLSNQHHGDFKLQSVKFCDSRNSQLNFQHSNRLHKNTEDTIQDKGKNNRGVLNSISEAISIVIERQYAQNIVATASIQSLKKTFDGSDTLKHFEKIFRNAYNEREGIVIPERMKLISSRIKHLFIMIDEITGDDSGVEFLQGITKILKTYELTNSQHGFNTKVIIADASIIDKNIINQHLGDKSAEPDKIYFRRTSHIAEPLSIEDFQFKDLPSTIINANSYPAKSLSITYKAIVESCQFVENSRLQDKNSLTKCLQIEILQDIKALLNRSEVEQIIVYIQDKQRLGELIAKIAQRTEKFQPFEDYIEIHADISDLEKEKINQYKNHVKIVFMTASGSRGLSFPKAKHILVEIPRFQIEKNLMEVIQVIYRGRGDDKIDNQDKEIIFYLAQKSVYYQDDAESQQLALQESVLSLLNILLILKAAIFTRIFGYGNIGRDNFIVIPIGGKSIFTAAQTFSAQIANLIKQLKQEHRRNRSDTLVENVYTSLEQLLGTADFTVRDTVDFNYLDLYQTFNHRFAKHCSSLDKLLDFGNIELGYISGNLLMVPIPENTLEETYQMQVLDIATYVNQKLWQNMQIISHSKSYPENLRFAIKDAIELINKLKEENHKTQKLQLSSQNIDQYYALPLFTFISGEVLKEYFYNQPEEPEDEGFRDILAAYIRLLYPVNNILPIGDGYKEFPFVLFRSYSLKEIRKKSFTDKYLLTSNELNVLNLILSQKLEN